MGFFPDVGGSGFGNRLPAGVGGGMHDKHKKLVLGANSHVWPSANQVRAVGIRVQFVYIVSLSNASHGGRLPTTETAFRCLPCMSGVVHSCMDRHGITSIRAQCVYTPPVDGQAHGVYRNQKFPCRPDTQPPQSSSLILLDVVLHVSCSLVFPHRRAVVDMSVIGWAPE